MGDCLSRPMHCITYKFLTTYLNSDLGLVWFAGRLVGGLGRGGRPGSLGVMREFLRRWCFEVQCQHEGESHDRSVRTGAKLIMQTCLNARRCSALVQCSGLALVFAYFYGAGTTDLIQFRCANDRNSISTQFIAVCFFRIPTYPFCAYLHALQ